MSESGCQLRDYEDIVKKILGNGSSYLLDELDYRKTTARLNSPSPSWLMAPALQAEITLVRIQEGRDKKG